MSVHHLYVVPTGGTTQYLYDLFKGVPFNVDWSTLCIEIGTSEKPISAKPTTLYHMVPGELGIYYDTATAMSHLLLPFFPSPKTAARHSEIGDAWHRPMFRPVMSFGFLQSNRRKHKALINSISTALIDTSPVFLFGEEQVVTDEAIVPEYSDFYRDYVERGQVLNQILLESDEGVD